MPKQTQIPPRLPGEPSPTKLLIQRFCHHKLGLFGLLLIATTLTFSFLGGWLSPYEESQVFVTTQLRGQELAAISDNQQYRFMMASAWPATAANHAILALNQNENFFQAAHNHYLLERTDPELTHIYLLTKEAQLSTIPGSIVEPLGAVAANEDFCTAFSQAAAAKATQFTWDTHSYLLLQERKKLIAYSQSLIGLASKQLLEYGVALPDQSFAFQQGAYETYVQAAENYRPHNFTANGITYTLTRQGTQAMIQNQQGQDYATIDNRIIKAAPGKVLSTHLKIALSEAYANRTNTLHYAPTKQQTPLTLELQYEDQQCLVKTIATTQVLLAYAPMSLAHPLGTDGNGMDIVTRLLYGGRVSLLIGLSVVVLETLLGMIIGGIAGYGGRLADGLLMRLVDVFTCLPVLPLVVIIGAALDGMRVDPQLRLVYLVLLMAILGWPPIARLVRGQLLSLRERTFLLAAEASGIPPLKRIFHHLLPNVAPQLIMTATLGLGDVILMESVLSFLGLGVKFPYASWGNMINAVSNLHVLTNYPLVWIPPGCCIFLTVLGFNLIGDGLREAFACTTAKS